MRYTDRNRICRITSPLGQDVLLLNRMSGHEEISRLFGFQLELCSEQDAIPFDAIVGKNITVTMELPDQKQRYFNGYVSRFFQGESDRRFVSYQLQMVPWLWFLTRTSDCRIFQDKTVPDIIQQIFEERGLKDFAMELCGSYRRWTYCVQYRETHFNFVSRLMEQEGISYYFRHELGRHTMVLVDSPSGNPPCPGQPDAEYASDPASRRAAEVEGLEVERELAPGRHALCDYNFETPSDNLVVKTTTVEPIGGNEGMEIYDWPGEYGNRGDGDAVVRIQMEAEEAASHYVRARSDLGSFCPGYRFELRNHYRRAFNQSYLLTAVSHSIQQGLGYGDGGASYDNTFTCIPYAIPYRPARRTPKPVVQGPQTAVVTGPKGEEIYVDQYGRVKVQFYWDREHQRDETSSCWIRVSQAWAGKAWGGMTHPRIGQEVIVEFIEGDPDRPIVTGRVYNAEQMPPYELPAHMTRSTLKSRSSKGGSQNTFNEMRYEDKKGQEQLFLHAERDMDHRVKNDSREWVGKNRHLIVKANRKELVEADQHTHVKGNQLAKVDGDLSLQVGNNRDEKIGMKYAAESGMEIHLKAGQKVVVEAGMQLTLKGAGGFITIGPEGVSISGTLVNINSGGAAVPGSGAQPKAPEAPDEADDGTKGTKLN